MEAKNEFDFMLGETSEEIEDECLNELDDRSFHDDLMVEFSPPETLVKRVILKRIPLNLQHFQLQFFISSAQGRMYDFFDQHLILKTQNSVPLGTIYQGFELIDAGMLWRGTLNNREDWPREIRNMEDSRGANKVLYKHAFPLPTQMTRLSLHHMGGGTWLCESSYHHHEGHLNTLPILPYGGILGEGDALYNMTPLYALPRLVNEHDMRLDIMSAADASKHIHRRGNAQQDGSFTYVPLPSKDGRLEEISFLPKITSGDLRHDLLWPPYESPFSYQSYAMAPVPGHPFLIDVAFRRS
ncbi:MAG: hypothetical protein ACTHJ4_05965 [Candidatus Nucleicultricaceae bacterium]